MQDLGTAEDSLMEIHQARCAAMNLRIDSPFLSKMGQIEPEYHSTRFRNKGDPRRKPKVNMLSAQKVPTICVSL